ncbi:hypothetical protein NZA98_04595, partial [Escherichia coli]|nr:hypothetical protein [Escherichia coli]
NRDIDVNIADMTVAELKRAWPFDTLVPAVLPDDMPKPGERPALPSDVLMASMEPPLVDYSGLRQIPDLLIAAAKGLAATVQASIDGL